MPGERASSVRCAGSFLGAVRPAVGTTDRERALASAVSQNCQYLWQGAKSGRGLPHSKTLRVFWRSGGRASVLECASPLALSTIGIRA